jgi:hypothetical protein
MARATLTPQIVAIWKRPECAENKIETAMDPQPKKTRINVPISSPRKFETNSGLFLLIFTVLCQFVFI